MDILNISLDFFHIVRDMTIDLFNQWDKVETVAQRFIQYMEAFTLEIISRI